MGAGGEPKSPPAGPGPDAPQASGRHSTAMRLTHIGSRSHASFQPSQDRPSASAPVPPVRRLDAANVIAVGSRPGGAFAPSPDPTTNPARVEPGAVRLEVAQRHGVHESVLNRWRTEPRSRSSSGKKAMRKARLLPIRVSTPQSSRAASRPAHAAMAVAAGDLIEVAFPAGQRVTVRGVVDGGLLLVSVLAELARQISAKASIELRGQAAGRCVRRLRAAVPADEARGCGARRRGLLYGARAETFF